MGNGLRNLAHLLPSYCQAAHRLGGINVDIQLIEQLPGLFIHLLVINQPAVHHFPAYEDILGNCQMAHHIQLLVHYDNSCILGFSWIGKLYLFSFICNRTFILCIDSGQHLHQCGLSRSVLSHQRVYFAPADLQVHMVQSMYAGKRLIYTLHG